MAFFENFVLETIDLAEGKLRVRRGGSGPPLLLLHGNPQTHVMWHAVAPALAARFSLICPDLRGYGKSFKPRATSDHAPYSKRAMAADMVALMDRLGFGRFDVAGHDRGARVAHRLALDHPGRVVRLAVLDIVPTLEHFERTDMHFAMGYYHWFWLAQPHPFPESLINAEPEAWFAAHTSREPKDGTFFQPQALADYLDCIRDPSTITAICEDYRAAATIDLDHDREDRAAGRMLECPLLCLWGAAGKIDEWYDPIELWQAYCRLKVTGRALECGHYLAEEVPEDVIEAFTGFFTG